MWECKCDCGKTIIVSSVALSKGDTKSCGCLQKEIAKKNGIKNGSKNLKDLTGKRFGRLLVLERVGSDKNGSPKWKCKCDCGNEIVVYGSSLRSGNTKSCGCYAKDESSKRAKIHGLSKTKLYGVWQGMKYRCNCETADAYKQYGGRGISVCDEWTEFPNFYEWAINNGYEEGLSIDRIDVNGNYEPSNCRWATYETQANNQRNNRIVVYNGDEYTVAQLMKKLDIGRYQVMKMYKS